MVRVTGEGAYLAAKAELTANKQMALPPPPLPVSMYFSLSLFSPKKASHRLQHHRRQERPSLCCCLALVPPFWLVFVIVDGEKIDSLPGLYHFSFQVVPC
ncbi:hypothetical protein TIFTF001_018059 [Ficus carica]|uniref:Uncharacterized protein n=1 Tax=Ficus carica TaxID=3494 RepID=A0AA88ABR4_FICCA|nr:hypothetical protein TIFTF001_018059 [Ficus carica]